jgi:hypothetical protein
MTLLDPRLGHAKAEAGSFGQKAYLRDFPEALLRVEADGLNI